MSGGRVLIIPGNYCIPPVKWCSALLVLWDCVTLSTSVQSDRMSLPPHNLPLLKSRLEKYSPTTYKAPLFCQLEHSVLLFFCLGQDDLPSYHPEHGKSLSFQWGKDIHCPSILDSST